MVTSLSGAVGSRIGTANDLRMSNDDDVEDVDRAGETGREVVIRWTVGVWVVTRGVFIRRRSRTSSGMVVKGGQRRCFVAQSLVNIVATTFDCRSTSRSKVYGSKSRGRKYISASEDHLLQVIGHPMLEGSLVSK